MAVVTQIQFTRGTAAEWTSADPTLAAGEFGWESDTNKAKIGTGSTAWTALAYSISGDAGDITGITVSNGIAGTSLTGPVPALTLATTAKGDLLAGTGSNTAQALAVGANDTVLTADSTAATGMKWAAAGGGGANYSLLNAGGTALTGAATITVSGISAANKIMVLVAEASASDSNSFIFIRLNGDSSAKYSQFGAVQTYDYSTDVNNVDSEGQITQSDNRIVLGYTANIASGAVSGGITFDGCNSAGIKAYASTGSGNGLTSRVGQKMFVSQGFYSGTSTISSVSISTDSGTLDAGRIYIYVTG